MYVPPSVDALLGKKVPHQEATVIRNKGMGELSKSDVDVKNFIIAALLEVAEDTKVRTDIDRRLRSGSGLEKHSHCCNEKCEDSISLLLQSVLSPGSLGEMGNTIIQKASEMYERVLERGRSEGEASMDAKTDSFIRRQILTETFIRECVKEVSRLHQEEAQTRSQEGFMFATPQALERKFSDDPDMLSMVLNQIPSDKMGDFVKNGIVVIPNFFSAKSNILKELDRMDASASFEPVLSDQNSRSDLVKWVTIPREDDSSYLGKLALLLSYVPFELNSKKRDLLLQVVQHCQVSLFEGQHKGKHQLHCDNQMNGRKITAIVPITPPNYPKGEPVIVAENGYQVYPSVNLDLVLIDSKTRYQCPPCDVKRFHLSVFLTGP